jgi:hypothetical protein
LRAKDEVMTRAGTEKYFCKSPPDDVEAFVRFTPANFFRSLFELKKTSLKAEVTANRRDSWLILFLRN